MGLGLFFFVGIYKMNKDNGKFEIIPFVVFSITLFDQAEIDGTINLSKSQKVLSLLPIASQVYSGIATIVLRYPWSMAGREWVYGIHCTQLCACTI